MCFLLLYSHTELHVFHQAKPATRFSRQLNRRCCLTRLQSSPFTSRDSNRSFARAFILCDYYYSAFMTLMQTFSVSVFFISCWACGFYSDKPWIRQSHETRRIRRLTRLVTVLQPLCMGQTFDADLLLLIRVCFILIGPYCPRQQLITELLYGTQPSTLTLTSTRPYNTITQSSTTKLRRNSPADSSTTLSSFYLPRVYKSNI